MRKTVIIFVLAVFACVSMAPAKPKKVTVRPTMVYTLAGCERCAALKSRLKRAGVRLNTDYTSERYFPLYPTVIYSNRTSDHGERIFEGRCSFPTSLQVVETD